MEILQVVANVLDECGNDIDAAIRRLGQLKLSSRGNDDDIHSIQQDQAVRSAVAATAPEALLPSAEAAGARSTNVHHSLNLPAFIAHKWKIEDCAF